MRTPVVWWWAAALVLGGAAGAAVSGGALRLWREAAGGGGSGTRYAVESTVVLRDAARRDRELAYRITAELDVSPAWRAPTDDDDVLLRFTLRSASLLVRGAQRNAAFHAAPSAWDALGETDSYARWRRGVLTDAYLDPQEPTDFRNYKRSLISLFQLQALDGESAERDASGECRVLYESLSTHVFRKIKRNCTWEGESSHERGSAAGGAASRRVARYELDAALGALRLIAAEELHTLGAGGAGLVLRAAHRLQLARAVPAAPAAAPDALPAAGLARLPLALEPAPLADRDPEQEQTLSEAVRAHREALLRMELPADPAAAAGEGAGEGAPGEAAAAALALLAAAERASPQDTLAVLNAAENHDVLVTLVSVLGALGRAESHRAAREALQLHSAEPLLPHARRYLAALHAAPDVPEWVVRDVLRVWEAGRAPRHVLDAALLAAAAAAAAGPEPAQLLVKEAVLKTLHKCKDAQCRRVLLTALGNLRRADTADVLLAAAGAARDAGGAGDEAAAREAAARALAAVAERHPRALTARHVRALLRLTLALDDPTPLEVRAVCLETALRAGAAQSRRSGVALLPLPLEDVLRALHSDGGGAARELQAVLWQRLAALANPADAACPARAHRALLRRNHPHVWLAHRWGPKPSMSSVLVREVWSGREWAAGGAAGGAGGAADGEGEWRLALDSTQLTSGGLLRSGAVSLSAVAPGAAPAAGAELLALQLWTRGLHALAGGEGEGEEEEAAAALRVSTGGAAGADAALFAGQGALLSLLWAGAGSTPTPVARALLPLAPRVLRVPLLTGQVARLEWRAAAVLQLDASAQVSLWARSAAGAVSLRAAGAARARAVVRAGWGALRGEAAAGGAPATLHILTDVDFYDGVSLCARVATQPAAYERNVTLRSELGAAAGGRWTHAVRRGVREALQSAPRSLRLLRENDEHCRRMHRPQH